ncbi:MAG: helix-turn-helix domain-containing protein [Microgenomates group bacterium]|jgi:cytoskeletal protein RodZ
MRTVGQILKEAREQKVYTLEQVEKAIKIRKEMLIALESDNYKKLPPPTFVRGFIKNYATFLGLDSSKLLAIFRREFAEDRHKPYVMDAFSNPVETPKFKLTPSQLLGGVVVLIVLSFFIYLWVQYRSLVGAPQLSIVSPVDQMTVNDPNLGVIGKTDPEVKVLVNSQEITVDSNGDFKETINLSSQVNKITIDAVSKFGQKTQTERTVYLKR